MNYYRHSSRLACRWICVSLSSMLILFETTTSAGNREYKFDSMQIGTQTYKNVTVTTRAKDYIFILHSGGMANIKVSELSQDQLIQFGYVVPEKPKTNNVSTWAKEKMATIESPEMQQLQETILAQAGPAIERFKSSGPVILGGAAAAALVLYLFSAYCCLLICRKTGNAPGILIWLPFLNLIPLLQAAGMSRAWFLGFLVPVLNCVACVVWSFKIVQALGKQVWLALLLLFPITSPFMLMYLAFSSGPARPKKERAHQIMTLEAV